MRVVSSGCFLGPGAWFVVALCLISGYGVLPRANAAVTSTTFHVVDHTEFDGQYSTTDLIQGRSTNGVDVIELAGDLGWHTANSNPADQLAALTDGIGFRPGSDFTGLLNDLDPPVTGTGIPVKVLEYPFTTPTDIGRINIFTGNRANTDGRIFSTTLIEYSMTNGSTFQPLGYFQSDPSGTINRELNPVPPLVPGHEMTRVSVFDDGSATLLSGVTNLYFTFYSVDNIDGQMRDPFDGNNPFTNTDDGLTGAFVSPLVLEIDVLAPQVGVPGDYNGNSVVDAADYVVWRKSVGADSLPNRVSGITGPIGDDDYNAWRARFGNTSGVGALAVSVPEPASIAMFIGAVSVCASARFGRRRAPCAGIRG